MGSRHAPTSHEASEESDDEPLMGEARPMRLRLAESAALLPDKLARRRRARRLMLRELALLGSTAVPEQMGRQP